MKQRLFLLGLLTLPASAQPIVGAVVNAASFAPAGLPNSPIAQGSMFTVFGSNMGPAALAGASSFPLQNSLAGTSVNVAVNGTTTQGIMIYSSSGQAAAVLPSKTPVGAGTLTVTYNGRTTSPIPIQVVQNNFGVFTQNQGGSGTAVILDGNGQPITPLNPAAPNQIVGMWGTGLGPIGGDETMPPPQVDMPSIPVEVYVGGSMANVTYRGRSGYAGVDQINFQVPPGQLGCSVAVAVKIGNMVSNFSTIAVSAGGPCMDANAYPASALAHLAATGTLNVAGFTLGRVTLPGGIVTELGDASFIHHTAASITMNPNASLPSIGSCTVSTSSSANPPATVSLPGLDAGPSITLSGASGTKVLPKLFGTMGTYSAGLSTPGGPPFISPGMYTFTGTGGADVGGFTVSSTVGLPLVWTNQAAITTVNRSLGVTVTWSGGPAGGYALITGGSTQVMGTTRLLGNFFCFADLAPGQFTVPSFVLLSLPPTTQNMGTLSVGGFAASFVPSPPGIDLATTNSMDSAAKQVPYQ
jgi:uncharacterized protein (TIGR03437 family)